MQDAVVNAVNAVPAVMDQFLMIVRFIKNDFCLDAASRWFEFSVMPDQSRMMRRYSFNDSI
jgi:hypothetical protein